MNIWRKLQSKVYSEFYTKYSRHYALSASDKFRERNIVLKPCNWNKSLSKPTVIPPIAQKDLSNKS